MFYTRAKIIEHLLTEEGVIEFLKEREETFNSEAESINAEKILPIVNSGNELSLLVFGESHIFKIYCGEALKLNWSVDISVARAAKNAKINPIKIESDDVFDIFIFPYIGEKRYKVQRSLFIKNPFVETYNEMLE